MFASHPQGAAENLRPTHRIFHFLVGATSLLLLPSPPFWGRSVAGSIDLGGAFLFFFSPCLLFRKPPKVAETLAETNPLPTQLRATRSCKCSLGFSEPAPPSHGISFSHLCDILGLLQSVNHHKSHLCIKVYSQCILLVNLVLQS